MTSRSRKPPRHARKRDAPRGDGNAPQHPSPAAARRTHADEPAFRRPSPDVAILYGFHAVREALATGKRKLLALYATEAAATRISEEARNAGLEPTIVDAQSLSRRLGMESVHQGLMLEARPLPEADIADIESVSGIVLVLDQITDPHNVGAILRTAAAFAVDALVTTERNSPEFSGALAKAASGALEHVTVVSVVNLARALEQLAERGYAIVGLDSAGEQPLEEAALSKPVALVLGAEGKGLRRLTRENCDVVARLDMPGAIKSLNVSNACAVALTVLKMRLA
jgi:23S rRNA (guanosine2251-2'-O)-methyltransferase